MSMEDTYINQKNMKPFWVFADLFDGKHIGAKFLCFINTHYPPEMVSGEEEVNKRGAEKLKNGSWIAEVKKEMGPEAKVGWGYGNTPQEAFRKACYSSGYLKVKDVS